MIENELKKQLLTRKFSSTEYMEEMLDFVQKSLAGMKDSIQWFYDHPPSEVDWENWHISDRPDGWEERAVPNIERLLESIIEGIQDFKNGDPDRIRGTANNVMTLSRDMDVLGEKWWDYVDLDVARTFGVNLGEAMQRASNIYRTIGGGFDYRPGTILNEEITGPIDEQDLLKYLKPGEEIENI